MEKSLGRSRFTLVVLFGLVVAAVASGQVFTEFVIPTAGSDPIGIAAGPDGNLWFTEFDISANKIGRITTAGTFTQPTGQGDLRTVPGGGTLPLVSTMNWRAGQTRANNAIITLGSSGDVTAPVDQASGSVQFIIDVNGYFR